MFSRVIPPVVLKYIADNFQGSKDVDINEVWYWSRIRFQFDVNGNLGVGPRRAFSYAVGQDMAPGGFPAQGNTGARIATPADTNLLETGKTRLNATLFVEGIAAHLMSRSDGALVQRVFEECTVSTSTDGQNTTPLCPLDRLPAAGGLHGAGRSAIKLPPIGNLGVKDNGEGAIINAQTNGMPLAGNLFMLEEPILWSGTSGRDSNFRLIFDIDAAIAETVAAQRNAASGVGAFTPPAAVGEPGTFVDLRIYARALSVSKPSVNSNG